MKLVGGLQILHDMLSLQGEGSVAKEELAARLKMWHQAGIGEFEPVAHCVWMRLNAGMPIGGSTPGDESDDHQASATTCVCSRRLPALFWSLPCADGASQPDDRRTFRGAGLRCWRPSQLGAGTELACVARNVDHATTRKCNQAFSHDASDGRVLCIVVHLRCSDPDRGFGFCRSGAMGLPATVSTGRCGQLMTLTTMGSILNQCNAHIARETHLTVTRI